LGYLISKVSGGNFWWLDDIKSWTPGPILNINTGVLGTVQPIVPVNRKRRLLVLNSQGAGNFISFNPNPDTTPAFQLPINIEPYVMDYETWGHVLTGAWFAKNVSATSSLNAFEVVGNTEE
jgi:hypothetical protein